MVDAADYAVYLIHRPVQLDLRLHDVFHHVVRLRLLGQGTGAAVSDRLVRRIAADANADYPRYPHQWLAVREEQGELAADVDHARRDGGRHRFALYAVGAAA